MHRSTPWNGIPIESGSGDQAPDLVAATGQLGISEQALMEALGSEQGPPDFEAAAEAPGVTVEALQSALGLE